MSVTHRDCDGRSQLRALIEPSTLDRDARTVELVWGTEAPVLRWDWVRDRQISEVLDFGHKSVRLDRIKSGGPVLDSHDGSSLSSQVGVVEDAWIEGNKGAARVRFAKTTRGEEALSLVADRVVQSVSVGYRIYEQAVTEGDSATEVRITDWEPYEVSLVSMPADITAKVRGIAATEEEMAGKNKADAVKQPQEDQTQRSGDGGETDVSTESVAGASAVNIEQVRAEERARVSEISRLVRRAGLEADFADSMVSDGASVDSVRAAILDALAERSDKEGVMSGSDVEIGTDEFEKTRSAAVDWLVRRSGRDEIVRRAGKIAQERGGDVEKFSLRGGGGRFVGMSLVDMARSFLESSGVKTAHLGRLEIAKRALVGNSTSDFSTLFEQALHKVMLSGYETAEHTWRRWCGVTTVTDYRAHNLYRKGLLGTLDTVVEGGEYTNKTLTDGEREQVTIQKKGNVVALTEEAIINDDMSILSSIASDLGAAAQLSIESAAFAALAENSGMGPALADTYYLFDSSNRDSSNVSTGAALSASALSADRAAMKAHMDINGEAYLSVSPSVLLVPPTLYASALAINAAEFDPDGSNDRKPNVAKSMFRDVVDSPYLSGTRRYLFADPGVRPSLVVAFLDGQQAPTVERRDGFRVDGVEWKVKMPFKVAAVEWRFALTNAGA